ncbi:polysaccharide biosynthesis tyrosine autokinase [Ningiella sp. W23]|uniref:polysaccharide biosynthesis tyrosine autokinase n=1 Tax=Ningiella sp. W23 TaxID=3023715 RepID=UPI003756E93D
MFWPILLTLSEIQSINSRRYFRAVKRLFWRIVGLAFCITVLAILISFTLEKKYTAKASLLLEPPTPLTLSTEAKETEPEPKDLTKNGAMKIKKRDISGESYLDFLNTQYQVLASRPLAERVVKRMKLDQNPYFDISKFNDNQGLVLRIINDIRALLRTALPFLPAQTTPKLSDEQMSKRLIQFATDRLLASIKVVPVENSHVLTLEVETPDPSLSHRIANNYLQTYINDDLRIKKRMGEKTLAFMQERLTGLSANLEESELALLEFYDKQQLGTKNGSIDLGINTSDPVGAKFQLSPQLVQQMRSLQREVEINQHLYKVHLSELKSMERLYLLQPWYARILERASQPESASSPNQVLIVLVSFVLSALLGIFLACLNEWLNSVIRSVEDAEYKLSQRCLGALPYDDELHAGRSVSDMLKHDTKAPGGQFFANSLVDLSEGLYSLLSTKNTACIQVTSTLPKEGVSTVSIVLAFLCGQRAKVLLVDANLRERSLAKVLRLPKHQAGVVDILCGTHSVEECLVKNEKLGIQILSAGSPTPKPESLLKSEAMEGLIEKVRDAFDYIFIDSPAMHSYDDSIALARLCDSTIYVVKADGTHYELIQSMQYKLKESGNRIEGTILNQARFAQNESENDSD